MVPVQSSVHFPRQDVPHVQSAICWPSCYIAAIRTENRHCSIIIGPVRSQFLIWNQFFVFPQPKNWLSDRTTGCRSKNQLRQRLGAGLLSPLVIGLYFTSLRAKHVICVGEEHNVCLPRLSLTWGGGGGGVLNKRMNAQFCRKILLCKESIVICWSVLITCLQTKEQLSLSESGWTEWTD